MKISKHKHKNNTNKVTKQFKPSKQKRIDNKQERYKQIKCLLFQIFGHGEKTNAFVNDAVKKYSPVIYMNVKLNLNTVEVPCTWHKKIWKKSPGKIDIEPPVGLKNINTQRKTDVINIFEGEKEFFTQVIERDEISKIVYDGLNKNDFEKLKKFVDRCKFVNKES